MQNYQDSLKKKKYVWVNDTTYIIKKSGMRKYLKKKRKKIKGNFFIKIELRKKCSVSNKKVVKSDFENLIKYLIFKFFICVHEEIQ